MPQNVRHRLPPIELPDVGQVAFDAVNAELGDDWDDEALSRWIAQGPEAAAQRLKAWGALDMQFEDEAYGCGGWSPLMLATSIEPPDVALRAVNALLDAGANVLARTAEGSSVLGIAMMSGHVTVVQRLLAAGADPTVSTCAGITPLHHVGYALQLYQGTAQDPATPRLLADALLQAGADPNAVTLNDRTTPLQMLVGMGADRAAIDRLVQAGADPLVRVPPLPKDHHWHEQVEGDTLLHLAVRHRSTTPDVVAHLVSLGVDPHALNARLDNALGVLMGSSGPQPGSLQFDDILVERRGLVQALLDQGVDPNARNAEGWSPWLRLAESVAAHGGRGREQLTPEVLAMVEAGADLHAPWPNGTGSCLDHLNAMPALSDREKAQWIERMELRAEARGPETAAPASRARSRL